MKNRLLRAGAAVVVATSILAGAGSAFAADHGDAPLAKENVPLDIADVYAFEGDGDNVVLAMTVNGLSMPGSDPLFDTAGLYQLKIDNDGDAVADVAYKFEFGAANSSGVQSVSVKKATGSAAGGTTSAGDVILSGDTEETVEGDGMMLFAGERDDPFFFDLNAFNAGLAFRNPGNNFFKGLNVSAIVLEVPASDFLASGGSTEAGVWAVTSKGGTIIDRMGRPAIATVFIPADQKDAFNQTAPSEDVARWKSTLVAGLESLNADPALADALLPDILTFDTSMAMNFLNGRALTDDVIDAELQLITGNMAASDNVANDSTFLDGFPYLGVPNTGAAPTPVPVSTAAAPTASAGSPQPAATATRPSGVSAPDTGTGDGTGNSDSDTTMWLLLAAIGAGVVLTGGALAARSRRG